MATMFLRAMFAVLHKHAKRVKTASETEREENARKKERGKRERYRTEREKENEKTKKSRTARPKTCKQGHQERRREEYLSTPTFKGIRVTTSSVRR